MDYKTFEVTILFNYKSGYSESDAYNVKGRSAEDVCVYNSKSGFYEIRDLKQTLIYAGDNVLRIKIKELE